MTYNVFGGTLNLAQQPRLTFDLLVVSTAEHSLASQHTGTAQCSGIHTALLSRSILIVMFYMSDDFRFLLHDATLVWYMPLSCVCVSVCNIDIVSKWPNLESLQTMLHNSLKTSGFCCQRSP